MMRLMTRQDKREKKGNKYRRLMIFNLSLFLAFSSSLWAKPVEVTFYPNSALVRESFTLPILKKDNQNSVSFELPLAVDPSRITIQPEQGISVLSVSWEQNIPPQQDNRKELQKAKERLNELLAEDQIAELILSFWKEEAVKKTSFSETVQGRVQGNLALVKQIEENATTQLKRRFKLEKELNEQRILISVLEGKAQEREVKNWKINVQLLGANNTKKTIQLESTYLIYNAAWIPKYRIDAQPSDKKIDFTWSAELTQNTGQDWSDIKINLSTSPDVIQLRPNPLFPWSIGVYESPVPMPVGQPMKMMAQGVQSFNTASETNAIESDVHLYNDDRVRSYAKGGPDSSQFKEGAVVTENYQSTSWSLGEQTLRSGIKQTLVVKQEKWDAQFIHLLRPSQNENSFVRGEVTFDEDPRLPRGEALFMLEGTLIAQERYGFTPSTIQNGKVSYDLYFGEDKLVTATKRTLESNKDISGTFSKTQNYRNKTEIELNNLRSAAVDIVLEEPKPMITDKRITTTFNYTPPADITDENQLQENSVQWHFTMTPKEKKKLILDFSLEAPKELKLILGTGWNRN